MSRIGMKERPWIALRRVSHKARYKGNRETNPRSAVRIGSSIAPLASTDASSSKRQSRHPQHSAQARPALVSPWAVSDPGFGSPKTKALSLFASPFLHSSSPVAGHFESLFESCYKINI